MLRRAHVYRAIAHGSARIVDPMRESIPRPWHGNRHEQVALIIKSLGFQTAVTNQAHHAAEHRAALHGNFHLLVGLELRVIRNVLRCRETQRRIRVDDMLARLIEAPADEAIAYARNGLQRDLVARGKHAGAVHAAAAARLFAPHHRCARNRHLVGVGELRLQFYGIALEP